MTGSGTGGLDEQATGRIDFRSYREQVDLAYRGHISFDRPKDSHVTCAKAADKRSRTGINGIATVRLCRRR